MVGKECLVWPESLLGMAKGLGLLCTVGMHGGEARGQHSIMGLACCALLIDSSFPYLLDKPFLLIIASPQILRHSRHLNRHSQDILSKMRKDSWDWQSELRIIGTTVLGIRQIKFDEPTFNYNYLVPTKQCSGSSII